MPICRFCNDRGCLACPGERKRAERTRTERIRSWRPPTEEALEANRHIAESIAAVTGEDPDDILAKASMPEPMFVLSADDPEDWEALKRVFGREVLERAFGEGGGGEEEIMRLAEEERGRQAQRKGQG